MKYDFDLSKSPKKKRRSGTVKGIIFGLEIIAVILIAYLLTALCAERVVMPGNSMQITLENEDSIIVDKLSYRFRDPERFEVIVFKASEKSNTVYDIKRIIGLPGEKVTISDGYVYINDELLFEPMQTDEIFLPGLAEDGIILDEDEYFVLGDNRNNSEDSRFATVGNISRESIIGRAFIRTNKFNFVNKLNTSSKLQDSSENEDSSDKEEPSGK